MPKRMRMGCSSRRPEPKQHARPRLDNVHRQTCFTLFRLTVTPAGPTTYTASMTRFDVDLFVIGGGSGGVRAARVAAEHGARTAIAEADRWGGTCVIRGCVPKKLLVYASEISRTLEDARGQGWTIGEARHDWSALIAEKDKEIARLSSAYVARLRKAGAEVIAGHARLVDGHTIEVAGRTITAGHVLIATG